MPEFAVIQEAYGKIDAQLLAPVLAQTLGMVRYDALRMAKEGRGIVAEHLTTEQAEKVHAALAAQGVPAYVIGQECVVEIGKPRRVRTIQIDQEALGVVWGYTGAPEYLPWDWIFLLSAGETAQVERVQAPRESHAPRRGGSLFAIAAGFVGGFTLGKMVLDLRRMAVSRESKAMAGETITRHHLLDIFVRTPRSEIHHIRLRSRDMYYQEILGDDFQPDFLANFRLVLARIGLRASKALVSPETQAVLDPNSPPAEGAADPFFGEDEEFSQYNRWLAQKALQSMP